MYLYEIFEWGTFVLNSVPNHVPKKKHILTEILRKYISKHEIYKI